jgi:hypothetical protein
MKKHLFPAAALIFCALLMSFIYFPKDDSRLPWEPSVKLTWEDFQGAPDESSTNKAMSHSTVTYDYKAQKEVIQVEATAVFDRKSSWVSPAKNAKSPGLLKHEQLHFDMTELMARRIRKEISVYISKDIPSTQAYIDQVHAKYQAELDAQNQLYDTETNHGVTESKQKKWETKINAELKKLDAFAVTKVEIQRKKN